MAVLGRITVPLSRLSEHLYNFPHLRTSTFRFCNSSLNLCAPRVAISSRRVPSVDSSSFGGCLNVQRNAHGLCRCTASSSRSRGSETGGSSGAVAVVLQEVSTPGAAVGFRHEVATPLCERTACSIASLIDVLRWRKQAQELASTVGSEFLDTDGGPEVSDLLRELEWLLDDAVAGCACWSENLDVLSSSSWKQFAWRDVKDLMNSKVDSDFRFLRGTGRRDQAASEEDVSDNYGAFGALCKERYSDPVIEFAADCGCSCDGIRESLAGMASSEEIESEMEARAGVSRSKRVTDEMHGSPTSSSKNATNLQLVLRMSLTDLDKSWKERILRRKPFQYVVAAAHWRDFVLSVMEGVLIPRPETEQLVDLVEAAISNNESLRYGIWADLGTGSGAIAIAVARLLHHSGSMVAIDASSAAVAVANRNVIRYSLQDKVKVLQGFWFSPLQNKVGELAGIVSNPPYIPTKNLVALQAEVGKHEPRIALDGGPDGMDDLLEICRGSATVLRSGGFLALETNGGEQAEALQYHLCEMRVIEETGNPAPCFQDVKCVKDFAGITRFVTAFRQ